MLLGGASLAAAAPQTWSGAFDGGTVAATITPLDGTRANVKIVGTGHLIGGGLRRCDFDASGVASVKGGVTTLHVDDHGTETGTDYVFTRTGDSLAFTTNLDLFRSSCTYQATLRPGGVAAQAPQTPPPAMRLASLISTAPDGVALYRGTFQAKLPYTVEIGFKDMPNGLVAVGVTVMGGKPVVSDGRLVGNTVTISRLGPDECHFAFSIVDGGRAVDAAPAPRCNDNPDFVGGRLKRVR